MDMPHGPAMYGLDPTPVQRPVCDCCQREVDSVRSSIWGHKHTCTECFLQWYDPDNSSFDNCDQVSLGNYVRSKHGLAPLED